MSTNFKGIIIQNNAPLGSGSNGQMTFDPSDNKLKVWLDNEWKSIISTDVDYVPFSTLTVGTSFPTSPSNYDSFYNSTTKRLYRYVYGVWVELDWQRMVKAGPEWRNNRLQVVSDQLQISPDGTNWYNCIPAVGAYSIQIDSFDNTGYSQLYYILPGTTVVIKNANHIPLVFSQGVRTRFNVEVQGTTAFENWIGLRPNNLTVSNGDGQFATGIDASAGASRSTSLNIFPLSEQAASTAVENRFNGTIHIVNNRMIGSTLGLAYGLYGVNLNQSSTTIPSTSYWLGTWYTQAGAQFNVQSLSIERRA